MNPLKILAITVLTAAFAAPAQNSEESADIKLPSGKSQQEEILKVEHQKAIEDAGKLLRLAEELKSELEKDEYHVLSVASLKKTEDIEKLARRIRDRLRR
jgi:hypothetical protein